MGVSSGRLGIQPYEAPAATSALLRNMPPSTRRAHQLRRRTRAISSQVGLVADCSSRSKFTESFVAGLKRPLIRTDSRLPAHAESSLHKTSRNNIIYVVEYVVHSSQNNLLDFNAGIGEDFSLFFFDFPSFHESQAPSTCLLDGFHYVSES